MVESLGTITLVEPTRLALGSTERVVVEYANQNDDVTHHIKTVARAPTWALEEPSDHPGKVTVPPGESKEVLDTTVEIPEHLGGRQGFQIGVEIGVPAEGDEIVYGMVWTPQPLRVPIPDAPQLRALFCPSGVAEYDRAVRNLLQQWGFDCYSPETQQDAVDQFETGDTTPACVAGVLPSAEGDASARPLVQTVVSAACSHSVPSLVFAPDVSAASALPEEAVVLDCALDDAMQLERTAGPELLGVRHLTATDRQAAFLDWIRGVVKYEPKELLRALVYATLLEQTGATEVATETLEDAGSLLTSPVALAGASADPTGWTKYRATTANTGHLPSQQGPTDNITVRWTHETGNGVYSSPAVVDGTVYIGSRDNRVYALDAATGRERWTHETGGDVHSSPAVVDGTVYVGSWDNRVYALTG